jgi:RNA recognition motif-containing protein
VVHADVLLAKGRSRGFGTVSFATPEDAQSAIDMFNDSEWDGRQIIVKIDQKKSEPRQQREQRASVPVETRALYVGNVPFSASWQSLKDLFKQAGVVERSDIPSDGHKKSKGFGLVVMQTVEEAQAAQEMFHNYEWNGRVLDVRANKNFTEGQSTHEFHPRSAEFTPRAHQNQSQDRHEESDSTCLFVGNLPYSLTSADLLALFPAGVDRIDMAVDANGRSKGYAQVHMQSHEYMQSAIDSLTGSEIDGREITIRKDKKRYNHLTQWRGSLTRVGTRNPDLCRECT